MPNFHIEGRQKKLSDIQMNFLWEIDIIDISSPLGFVKLDFTNVSDLSFRVKNISTPSRSIDTIETWFYGQKQNIPSKTSFGNNITLTIEETEDQFVLKTIYDWMESIQSVDPLKWTLLGLGGKATKKTMLIKQVKYNGEYTKHAIELKNVYPISLGESSLDFSGNDSVKYDIQFNYDYWLLRKS